MENSPSPRPGAAPDDAFQFEGAPVIPGHDGIRSAKSSRARWLIPYEDVTHIARSERVLSIGTLREVHHFRARDFPDLSSMILVEREIRDRIAAGSGGAIQLARMAEIDQLASGPRRRLATVTFVVLCLVAYWLQARDHFVVHFGSFHAELVAQGEFWRLVTANFLHAMPPFPIHLGLNVVCVLALGPLVERMVGALRTTIVIGASAVGAMVASALAGYQDVIGASGVVAGLAGALVCFELHGSRRLPVSWRIPRRLFLLALLLQAWIDWQVPYIAGAAHLGGFASGYLATRFLLADSLVRRPVGSFGSGVAAAIVMIGLMAGFAAAPLLDRDVTALESHALRLLHLNDPSVQSDNDVAWLMVTEASPSYAGLQVATLLAERAVQNTNRADPDLLDTLAEVLFASGDVRAALDVIDEAIEIARGESYFLEQRRRFTGERAAEDRPEPPLLPWFLRSPEFEAPLLDPEAPGVPI
jgi:membrane associated rhomboid family serine protease